jgi:hypothetical protein
VALHHPRAAADHELAGGPLRDRNREHGAGQFERAADRQRLVGLPLRVPFFDVEVEAGQLDRATTSVIAEAFFLREDT